MGLDESKGLAGQRGLVGYDIPPEVQTVVILSFLTGVSVKPFTGRNHPRKYGFARSSYRMGALGK